MKELFTRLQAQQFHVEIVSRRNILGDPGADKGGEGKSKRFPSSPLLYVPLGLRG